MHRTAARTALIAALSLLGQSTSNAQTSDFVRIADTLTPAPSGGEVFSSFTLRMASSAGVAFFGVSAATQRAYVGDGTSLAVVPDVPAAGDSGTPGFWPGGPVSELWLDGSTRVVLATHDVSGSTAGYDGVFQISAAGAVQPVATAYYLCASCSTEYRFLDVGRISGANGVAYFAGRTQDRKFGLYTSALGAPLLEEGTTLADGAVVDHLGPFRAVSDGVVYAVAVTRAGASSQEVYRRNAAGTQRLVDGSALFPGLIITEVDANEVSAVLQVDGGGDYRAIYLATAAGVVKVAESGSLVAGNSASIVVAPSLSGSDVTFMGRIGQTQFALFARLASGTVRKVLGPGDTFDGRVISTVQSRVGCFVSGRVATLVAFDDGSAGLYQVRVAGAGSVAPSASVPAGSLLSLLILAIGLVGCGGAALLLARTRRRA